MKPTIVDKEYLNFAKTAKNIQMVIMGKDPFPSGAIGIPFCKCSWDEQLKSNSSGKIVLSSIIGYDPERLKSDFNTPRDFFIHLAKQGIIFLNLSYKYNGGKPLRKSQNKTELTEALEFNSYFLDRALIVVLCGEAKKNKWHYQSNKENTKEVVHPDVRNQISRYENVRINWTKVWGRNNFFSDLTIK